MNHCRWNLLPPLTDKKLAGTGLPRLIAQLLYNRGVTEASQLEAFIAADERLSTDPFTLPDMHRAVARTYQALLSGEPIAIYGDFDVDGITATVLLSQGLSALGVQVVPYIPHRLNEGYGLKTAALEQLRREGISLVITVDCGITAVPEVKKAKRTGLDIIITDHHTPLPEVPPAIAAVNPRLAGSNCSSSELAGVGVAYKFLQALLQSTGKEKMLAEVIDLVALGTVADMMPLVRENRYLVRQGLEAINAAPRLGIRELLARTRINCGSINPDRISWIIAPLLNAAGRLAHAMTSYKLLVTNSPEEAQELSLWLEQKNNERQRLTADILARAREQVMSKGVSELLVASGDDFHIGIAGLVAGKLCEEFRRPAIVIETGERFSRGSCRSIPEFDIISALRTCSGLLTYFGGHPQAAGFTLPTRNLAHLEQMIHRMAARQLDGADLRLQLDIDAEVSLPDLTGSTFNMLQQLAPFGQGNPAPTFLSRRIEVIDCRTMGGNGDHLRLKLKQGNTVWDGVAFRLGGYLPEVSSPLDIVYNLEVDQWGGEERLRLNILDFASST